MNRLILSVLLALAVVLVAFTVRLPPAGFDGVPTLPTAPLSYADTSAFPTHIKDLIGSEFDNEPPTNRVTDAGATLGRVLFYDTRLSGDGTLSCASCHLQEFAFTDTARVSTGINGHQTFRNSMSLVNARFYDRGKFFWDERANRLEDQVLMPITDTTELGTTIEEAIARMEATEFYPALFEDAFGSPEITSTRISRALAQFIRSIVTYRSRYDEGRARVQRRTTPFPTFTDEENRGKTIFNGREAFCDPCHATDLQILDGGPANTGLDSVTTDPGVGAVTGRPGDDSHFKVPSLRNVALTAPFMHDGRFATLEEVIEHYNSGVQNHPTLSNALKTPTPPGPPFPPKRLNLSDEDKAAILAFLNTLTDEALTIDARWSDPFAQPIVLAARLQPTALQAGGGTISVQFRIDNTGATEFVTTPRATVTDPNGAASTFTQTDLLIAPGARVWNVMSIPIAADAPSGSYTVVAEVSGAPTSVILTFQKFGTGTLASKQADDAATAAANAAATEGVPAAFALHEGYPNPFTRGLTITLDVPKATEVTVEVLDLLGRRVAVIADGPTEAGSHALRWAPEGLPAGVYVVRALARGERVHAQRVTLVR